MRQSFWLTSRATCRRAGGTDDDRRVAAGSVGDRRLDVDRDAQPVAEVGLLAVDGADEVREPERPEPLVELAARVAGDEDADVAADVVGQPRLVEVVAVQVRDVEEVGVLDLRHQLVAELVVAREHEPRSEERRDEPRVADDRLAGSVSMRIPAWPSDVARIRTSVWRGTPSRARPRRPAAHGQATGGSVYCWPARETCSVHAPPSQ